MVVSQRDTLKGIRSSQISGDRDAIIFKNFVWGAGKNSSEVIGDSFTPYDWMVGSQPPIIFDLAEAIALPPPQQGYLLSLFKFKSYNFQHYSKFEPNARHFDVIRNSNLCPIHYVSIGKHKENIKKVNTLLIIHYKNLYILNTHTSWYFIQKIILSIFSAKICILKFLIMLTFVSRKNG